MKLVTSNPHKLAEFVSFGLDIESVPGADLREVQGTVDEVIIHKSADAGVGLIVEDTILEVDGEVIVDIRWRVDELVQRASNRANWIVSLAHNDGDMIHVYRGSIVGRLVPAVPLSTDFGFDPFFVPMGEHLSLSLLAARGLKSAFSARKRAVDALLADQAVIRQPLHLVRPWSGSYQH